MGTITHSWNGTVLTITSDSGTSSADLKGDMGVRGAQGIAGARGEALTFDDLTEEQRALLKGEKGDKGDSVKLHYVTPQDFGAVADGTTDDSAAIQAAINSHQTVIVPKGRYLLGSSIELSGSNVDFHAEEAHFKYSGTDAAFKFVDTNYSSYYFGYIESMNGNCLKFDCSGDVANTNLNIYFQSLDSYVDCIYAYTDEGVANNIYLHGGALFSQQKNGIKLVNNAQSDVSLNGWVISNCDFSGCKEAGVRFESTVGTINNMTIEYPTHYQWKGDVLINTNGYVNNLLVISAQPITQRMIVSDNIAI